MGIEEKIEKLQERLDKTPVNKGTEKDRARLKARISELREEKEKRAKETGGGGGGYSVQKQGDATVALVGPPSVGKSTFLNAVTNADSETGAYEFTTLDVVPGMLEYRGARIQLLDVPGLIGGAAEGKGGGKQVLSVVRNSDLVLMMTDPDNLEGFERMEKELYDAGMRLDAEPPNVKITKKDYGGLEVKSTVEQPELEMETVREVLEEKGLVNASVVLREELTIDRLLDALSNNRRYVPSVKALNKSDTLGEERGKLEAKYPDAVFLSAETGEGIERLKEEMWEKLDFMRLYMKKPGKEPDREEPLIVERGSTVGEVMRSLAGDFAGFKHARIWGESADFPEQKVGEDHVLQDEDVVEIRTK